jgi:hypothetical protein
MLKSSFVMRKRNKLNCYVPCLPDYHCTYTELLPFETPLFAPNHPTYALVSPRSPEVVFCAMDLSMV